MKNKDKTAEKRLVEHDCDICGGRYALKHKSAHEKSNKHQNALANTTTNVNR